MPPIAFFRDLFISLFNIAFGRLRSSLLPRIPDCDLTGKTALITGGNSGIGLSIGKTLAARGCKVFLTSRSLEKGEQAVAEVKTSCEITAAGRSPQVELLQLDNASFESVRGLVQTLDSEKKQDSSIDFLFLNAGFPGSASNRFTEDGHELTYQTNFLSSFLMIKLMLDRGLLSPEARIVFTASTGQYSGRFSADFKDRSIPDVVEPGFHAPPFTKAPGVPVAASSRYANTKLMQAACAKLLQSKFDEIARTTDLKDLPKRSTMSAYSFSPGYCATPIFEKADKPTIYSDPFFWLLVVATKVAIPIDEGAATGVYLALEDDIQGGGYWDRCDRRLSTADLMGGSTLKRLWKRWCTDANVE